MRFNTDEKDEFYRNHYGKKDMIHLSGSPIVIDKRSRLNKQVQAKYRMNLSKGRINIDKIYQKLMHKRFIDFLDKM